MTSVQLLRESEVCSRLAVGRTSFWRLRKSSDFPAPILVGGARRWRESDVAAWIAQGGSREAA